jgi:hypothetical protein
MISLKEKMSPPKSMKILTEKDGLFVLSEKCKNKEQEQNEGYVFRI